MASTSNSGIMGAFDGIAPSASTSASTRAHKPCYDVFINHRGPDVKHTLASVLYGILTDMSLSVFLDSEESEYGDFLPQTIEAAMASALIHIAIFSQRYAESPWCLAELSFMLKSGATIIPIFYHVDPSDLRWVGQGKGIYVQAFKEHERKDRYSPEKLQEWKTALHKMSFYHGQIINTNEDELRMLKNIVSCILKVKDNNIPFVVAKHPVGLKEIVEDFKTNTLQSLNGNQEVQIVGIWGMGGSGKTTLAKELYNEISSSMERFSFVFNVRDAATKGLLHEKQKNLLRDLGIHGLTIDNVEEGMRTLSRALKSVRVLIVLDDVDNVEQLDVLLPTKDSLESGSLIVVTTRAYDVLRSWGISSIYKMKELNPLHAEQLFCWHAFLKSCPPDGFKELVERFLKVCNGLPLSLKVFGAQLHGESRKEHWESQLHKISKTLFNDIKQTLKISYDSLDDEEKEMFLDVACFFIGEERSLAIEVWNGLGWSGLRSWERLLHKCLVELDHTNSITMHDHLRDLGRNIANEQSPYRLWIPQQIINVQKQNKRRIGIQGIIATSNQFFGIKHGKGAGKCLPLMVPKETVELDEFGVGCPKGKLVVNTNRGIWSLAPSSVGLKYLLINGELTSRVSVWPSWLQSNKQNLPPELSRQLVWLRWSFIGRPKLSSGLSLKNLRVLELYERDRGKHHLKELWGESDGEAPVQLRQLLISRCRKFQGFPKSIGQLKHLKKIVITEGYNANSLPDEFCLLQSLEHLVFENCAELSSLPNNFGNLRSLRHLCLSECTELRRLPLSFKNLMLLEHLNLQACRQLTFTSEEDLNFLENITKLEHLSLSYCRQLEELPRHVTNQASLREIYFGNTRLRELPDNIGQLSRLRKMNIERVPLTSLPTSLGDLSSLTNLSIHSCDELECLPDTLGNLSSLTNLEIGYCPRLERLPESIGDLSSLISLSISDCPKLEREGVKSLPKSIRQLNNLQELTIQGCPISELDFGLSNLKKIDLSDTEVCRISFSDNCCPYLESLRVYNNHHLEEMELGLGLSNLKEIDLFDTEVCRISFSEACCPHLENLYVCENHHLEEIEALPKTLQSICMKNCEMLKSIPSFAGFTSLTKIQLEGCYEIQKLEGLENCTSLLKLTVETCWEVPGIESLEHLQNLKLLQLKANKGSVIERCIQRMQKWPDEGIIMCARAVPDAASLVDSLLSPNLVIVDSFSNKNINDILNLEPTNLSSGGAFMFCFVMNCVSSEIFITVDVSTVKVEKGRWVLVIVVPQGYRKVGIDDIIMRNMEETEEIEGRYNEVEKGLVLRGEGQIPVEAVRSLLPLFLQS